jgi:hypothetical protein
VSLVLTNHYPHHRRTRERDLDDAFYKFGPITRIDLKNGFAFIVSPFSSSYEVFHRFFEFLFALRDSAEILHFGMDLRQFKPRIIRSSLNIHFGDVVIYRERNSPALALLPLSMRRWMRGS